MATDIIMPKMGESITEGTITEWKKKVGDQIKKDETILEISTDKVDTEVPSPASGILIDIFYNENDTVDVGSVIGSIGDMSEKAKGDIKVESKKIQSNENNNKVQDLKVIQPIEKEVKLDLVDIDSKLSRFYSPIVRSIAKRERISITDLDKISGSGRGGRVNKVDVMNFIKSNSNSGKILTSDKYSQSSENRIEEMDPVRKKISEHMIHSQETSAHVYSTIEIDMTNLLKIKKSHGDMYKRKHSIKLSVTSLLIDACIKALGEFPLLNTSIDGTNIIHHKNINMGVAVALQDNNLIVPVIKSSEERNLIGISRSLEDLSIRARNKQLSIDEVQGSTFTITNPGIFGGLFGIPILNQPNVGILSIGKIQKKPIVKETEFGDSIFIRSMMYVTLGYDHRLIDGAYGTRFLSYLSEIIESYGDKLEK